MSIVPATGGEYDPSRNIEAEMCALGCMMLSERACMDVCLILTEQMFYQPSHKLIFAACADCYRTTQAAPDLVLVRNVLEERKDRHGRNQLQNIGGIDYLVQVMGSVPSAVNARAYAGIVRDKWVRRESYERGRKLMAISQDGESVKDVLTYMGLIG